MSPVVLPWEAGVDCQHGKDQGSRLYCGPDGIITVSLWDVLLLISGKAEEQGELVNKHRKLLGGLQWIPAELRC